MNRKFYKTTLKTSAVFTVLLFFSSPAFAFQIILTDNGTPIHWPDGLIPVSYVIGSEGSEDISDGSDIEEVKKSFQAWDDITCSRLGFHFDGLVNNPVEDSNDSENNIFWVEKNWPPEAGTYATGLTTVMYYTTGEITDADIIFNGEDYCWTIGKDPVCIDIAITAVHEIGHFFGLDHDNSLNSVMYPTVMAGEIFDWSFNQDDIDAICYLYPSYDGSVGSPCGNDHKCAGENICADHHSRTVCSKACPNNTGCDAGYYCDKDSGACLPSATSGTGTEDPNGTNGSKGDYCGEDAYCKTGLLCVGTGQSDYSCRTICTSDSDCESGEVCTTLIGESGTMLPDKACISTGETSGTVTDGECPDQQECCAFGVNKYCLALNSNCYGVPLKAQTCDNNKTCANEDEIPVDGTDQSGNAICYCLVVCGDSGSNNGGSGNDAGSASEGDAGSGGGGGMGGSDYTNLNGGGDSSSGWSVSEPVDQSGDDSSCSCRIR